MRLACVARVRRWGTDVGLYRALPVALQHRLTNQMRYRSRSAEALNTKVVGKSPIQLLENHRNARFRIFGVGDPDDEAIAT